MAHPSVPETTSAEHLDSYPPGLITHSTHGPAWADARLSVFLLTTTFEAFQMPAVAEPFIVWVTSGDAQAQERVAGEPWHSTRLRRGSLFITAGGAPYDFRWQRLSEEPLEVVMVLLDLALFEEALHDSHGPLASKATLRDLSGVEDASLVGLLQCLRDEADQPAPSAMYVRGIAQAIAVHLSRHYVDIEQNASKAAASLPPFKLRRIMAWMVEHLDQAFSLAALAEQAGMSEYHFNRLFKRATGVPPSQHHIALRMAAAKRLLRETDKTVITVANEVGYANPSHFARTFRKSTGLTPSDYRRQR